MMNLFRVLPVALLLCLGTFVRAADSVTFVDRPDISKTNAYYPGNRAPLSPSAFINLPFGAIKPQGWLRKQLELEAAGFTGHLTEISDYCRPKDNAWRTPSGEGIGSWEEVPYWFRGYAALGYILDDPQIIKEAQVWIDATMASQTDFGFFGPNANLKAPIHPAVPTECLTTPDGKPGLAAEYFDGKDFKTSKLTRIDPVVDFTWGRKPPTEGLSPDYGARWTGNITVKTAGDYFFSLYSGGGARLWIDGAKVVDDWGGHSSRTFTARQPFHMEAGKSYTLKLEYAHSHEDGEIRLGWKVPGATYRPGHVPDLMPNMNMLFALRSCYEYTGDRRVLDVMKKYFQWELTIPDKQFYSGGWQVPRNGDDIENAYWLYNRTGDAFLLEVAAKLQRCGALWMSTVTGGHNVDFSQGFRKPATFYQQNHDPKFLQATEKNWESIMDIYGQVPGGMFGGDEFARPKYTDPRQAIETCGAVEMMISDQILLRITGENKWADRCENIAFNTLPATMTADMKALRYLTSPNQVNSDKRSKAPELADGGPMQVMNPHDHRCCQHNSGAGWPYYAASLWQATPDSGLAAVFYSASDARAKVGDGTEVAVHEETRYPFEGTVEFTVTPAKAVAFPLYLRVPAWCKKPQVAVNGKDVTPAEGAGRPLLAISRTWNAGDKVRLTLPMELAITTWTKNQNSASVNYGPLTFSLKIGEKYVPYEPKRFKEPWPAWEIVPTTPWNYALDFNPAKLAEAFQVVAKAWPADNMPFTLEGAPIEIKAQARKLPNWKEDHIGLVDKLQPSPVKATEPAEAVTLVPMGAARLRISAFPVIGTGPDAREWQLPEPPLASYSRGNEDPYEAMFDGKLPKNSHDRSVRRFTTYSFGGAEHGKLHWVQRNLGEEKTVSSCEVYWYDEATYKGDVRLPKWWRVLYKSGDQWKEVEKSSGYPVKADEFNIVTFQPVKTTALRLEVQCQDEKGRYAMGIYEWRIK